MTRRARKIRTTRRARKIREALYLGMWAFHDNWSAYDMITEFHIRKYGTLQRKAAQRGYYSAR
jgi:hypothetical protein